MKLSVMIPTYGRAEDLTRCLSGLAAQSRGADQVILVLREGDEPSFAKAAMWMDKLPIQICTIRVPGVVQALNLGLRFVSGDIVTITDDDSQAFEDWLERIEAHFAKDPKLGGLGGRDIILEDGVFLPPTQEKVGLVLPYGRMVGNHHLGLGGPREVDFLKGVNMSWRVAAMGGRGFDTDLRGKGAQVSFELAYSFYIQSRGWRLVYDPEVKVHHFPAKRFGADQRVRMGLDVCEDLSFNNYVAILRYLQTEKKRTAAILWARLVGIANTPGVIRGLLSRIRGDEFGVGLRRGAARAWRDAEKLVANDR